MKKNITVAKGLDDDFCKWFLKQSRDVQTQIRRHSMKYGFHGGEIIDVQIQGVPLIKATRFDKRDFLIQIKTRKDPFQQFAAKIHYIFKCQPDPIPNNQIERYKKLNAIAQGKSRYCEDYDKTRWPAITRDEASCILGINKRTFQRWLIDKPGYAEKLKERQKNDRVFVYDGNKVCDEVLSEELEHFSV